MTQTVVGVLVMLALVVGIIIYGMLLGSPMSNDFARQPERLSLSASLLYDPLHSWNRGQGGR